MVAAIVFIFGLLVGSFLNVCIYRLPRNESLVFPASHCPACGEAIPPWLNIPVVSYRCSRDAAGPARPPLGKRRRPRHVPGVRPHSGGGYSRRFRRSRDVGPYLGLTPRRDQSGEQRSPVAHHKKAGDAFLRRLLTECAHYILGPFGTDCDLRRWGLKLAGTSSKKARKRAITAVARKLAVLLHRLWITGEVYEPLRVSQAGEAAA